MDNQEDCDDCCEEDCLFAQGVVCAKVPDYCIDCVCGAGFFEGVFLGVLFYAVRGYWEVGYCV